jgi:hypothetical protein
MDFSTVVDLDHRQEQSVVLDGGGGCGKSPTCNCTVPAAGPYPLQDGGPVAAGAGVPAGTLLMSPEGPHPLSPSGFHWTKSSWLLICA